MCYAKDIKPNYYEKLVNTLRETLTERKKMQILSYHVQIISRTLNEREEVETCSLLKACDIIEHF